MGDHVLLELVLEALDVGLEVSPLDDEVSLGVHVALELGGLLLDVLVVELEHLLLELLEALGKEGVIRLYIA